MSNFCKKPDRHAPKLECGHPIPCPYHTIVIDLDHQLTGRVAEIITIFRNADGKIFTHVEREEEKK